jgi:hypothetical protein
VLTVPETKGRYYLLALLDAYTNVAASIGKRTTGHARSASSRSSARLQGHASRGHVRGQVADQPRLDLRAHGGGRQGDIANAAKIQDQYKLAGPRRKARRPKGAAPAKGAHAGGRPPPQASRRATRSPR